jgi:RimJ/RimL family protein N-acetyltransferase
MDADAPHPTALEQAWPLFGLRIRTERLELRLPTDDLLLALMDLARAGIHPPDEMPFGVAWSTRPSPDFERGFLAYHWANRSGWSPEAWELGLAVLHDGRPIGMQGLHAHSFPAMRTVGTGSWLGREHQGKGLGKEMRAAVLAFAFEGLDAEVAETEAFSDNAASSGVSPSLGYEENGRGGIAPEGRRRETLRYRMTREQWSAGRRPPVVIEGLDACWAMFVGVG